MLLEPARMGEDEVLVNAYGVVISNELLYGCMVLFLLDLFIYLTRYIH